MSSGYTPYPSPPLNEPMVEIPKVSTSKLEPQTDKGKEKVLEDTGKEQVLESVTPDTHFAQLDSYQGAIYQMLPLWNW